MRNPIPTWCFALVAVRRGDRFLVVQERKHGQAWYLPGGGVEPGERIVDAAVREALEESGVPVVLDGIIRVQHTARPDGTARMRVIFAAHPADDSAPHATADSLDARYVTLDELDALPLRGAEVRDIFRWLAGGGALAPLSLLTDESAPFCPF